MQTQLYNPPLLLGFINGLVSTAMFGIQDCEEGFGSRFARYSITDHPSRFVTCLFITVLRWLPPHLTCWFFLLFVSSWVQCHETKYTTPHQLRWMPSSSSASPEEVIAEMDLLLTGGRLSQDNKAIITQAYVDKAAEKGQEEAIEYAISHFAVAPEFQVTNRVFAETARAERTVSVPELLPSPPPVTDYKAIVYLYFAGGLDSYSLLMPHQCANNLNAQFHQVRGNMAVPNNQHLTINAGSHPQPCTTFGVHPKMPLIQELYNQGQASFFANIGTLVEPLTNSDEFERNSKALPPGLFAHNIQTGETQSVALDPTDGGVLGRIGDALNAQADKEVFDAYSISGTPKILDGAPGVSRPADVLTEVGVKRFTMSASAFEGNMKELNKNVATSIFAETYSEAISSAIGRKNLLEGAIGDLQLSAA